jgi:hypothetical protein
MGDSPRETETNQLLAQAKKFKPTVSNLFENYQDAFSTGDIMKATEAYTKKAIGDTQKATATGIKRSGSAVGRRFAGAGVTKGSIFEDAVAGAENQARVAGSNVIGGLQQKQLSLVPGIMNQGNQNKFRNTGASQNVMFGNKANEANQFGNLMNIISQLPDDTSFDDILALLNTGGNIVDAVIRG